MKGVVSVCEVPALPTRRRTCSTYHACVWTMLGWFGEQAQRDIIPGRQVEVVVEARTGRHHPHTGNLLPFCCAPFWRRFLISASTSTPCGYRPRFNSWNKPPSFRTSGSPSNLLSELSGGRVRTRRRPLARCSKAESVPAHLPISALLPFELRVPASPYCTADRCRQKHRDQCGDAKATER
jgi:hypothetical protein